MAPSQHRKHERNQVIPLARVLLMASSIAIMVAAPAVGLNNDASATLSNEGVSVHIKVGAPGAAGGRPQAVPNSFAVMIFGN